MAALKEEKETSNLQHLLSNSTAKANQIAGSEYYDLIHLPTKQLKIICIELTFRLDACKKLAAPDQDPKTAPLPHTVHQLSPHAKAGDDPPPSYTAEQLQNSESHPNKMGTAHQR
jgi:hypothetical protein